MKQTPTDIARDIIAFLKKHDLYDQLEEVNRLLEEEVARTHDITVISALPVPEKEQAELRKTLTEKWGDHPVVYRVDESLLSGLIVTFRDKVIDRSGRQALKDLRQNLTTS